MGQNSDAPASPDAAALLAQAEARGPGAALAARRAAILAERSDPDLAARALALAASLDPMDPSPRLQLARLRAEQGDLTAAREEANAVFKDAIDQAARARAAFLLGELARADGDHPAARAAFESALAIENKLMSGDRRDPTSARWYARARGRIAELDAHAGELGRARTGAEGALAMLRAAAAQIGEPPVLAADIADAEMRLAALELDNDQPASARRRLGEAIGRYEALAVTEKHEPHWRAVLADAWALAAEADYARGSADHARAAMDKALQARLKLASERPEEAWALAGTWRLHAALRSAVGDNTIAAESLAQARLLGERLCAQAPGAEAPARFLVHTLLEQSDHAAQNAAAELARDAADAARARAEKLALVTEAPAWFADTAACWDRLGEAARAASATAQTQDAFARAVALRRRACLAAPGEQRWLRGLAAALVKYGEVALAEGANQAARDVFAESVELRLRLAEGSPGDATLAHALAAALERLGLAARAMGDMIAARNAWEDELLLAERIFPDENDTRGMRFRAIVESHLARIGGPRADEHRRAALQRFDTLARDGQITEAEATLRRHLWGA